MRSLSQALTLEKNALFTPNAWLVLLDIKLQGAPDYHFCSGNENIAFQGRNYTASNSNWPTSPGSSMPGSKISTGPSGPPCSCAW